MGTQDRRVWVGALGLALLLAGWAQAQDGPAVAEKAEANPRDGRGDQVGQFFPAIVEPIRQEATQNLRSSVLAYLERTSGKGERPILVFEFRPGQVAPGESSFGAASDLADVISRDFGGAKRTVAYVPESLSGFALLPVLACDEIVVGPSAALGPIAPEGHLVTNREREAVSELARAKARETDLLLALLEPSRELKQVRTADGATRFLLVENLAQFEREHQVVETMAGWSGRAGVLDAEASRRSIAKLEAEDRARLAEIYGLPSTAADPTLADAARPVTVPIKGRIDGLAESFVLRQLARAKEDGTNLIFFEIDSAGGRYEEADRIADAIARLEGIKTVAYLDDQAVGVAAMIALACDEIAFKKGGRLGNVSQVLDGADATPRELDERLIKILGDRAEELARLKGHPEAVARGMIDPEVAVFRVRDKKAGAVTLALGTKVEADPARFEVLEAVKSPGDPVMTVTEPMARELGFNSRTVKNFDELADAYGLRGQVVRQAARSWVDGLVDTLNEPWMRGALLFLGFFMLFLELKLPGVGLPAILSTLAFLLYFWSGYLGGTASALEILLFLVGVVGLGIELFVFPGTGVFGMSGVFLILSSVVMASHTFVWPTESYQYRELAFSLFRVLGLIGGTIVGVAIVGKFLPSIPLFNRLILRPPSPEATTAADLAAGRKPALDPDAPFTFLMGEVGQTATVLRPSGKARFGDLLVDVIADGYWIGANQDVEVVEVQGPRVVVKKIGHGGGLGESAVEREGWGDGDGGGAVG
jgi:membrane-bound serine protease (ClpP class)